MLPQLDPDELDWTIPGWHEEKLRALLDSLPKATRKRLGFLDELARKLATELKPFDGPMLPARRARDLRAHGRAHRARCMGFRSVPAYLWFAYRIVDEHDKVVAEGRDITDLQARLGTACRGFVVARPAGEVRALGPHDLGLRDASRIGHRRCWWSQSARLSCARRGRTCGRHQAARVGAGGGRCVARGTASIVHARRGAEDVGARGPAAAIARNVAKADRAARDRRRIRDGGDAGQSRRVYRSARSGARAVARHTR